MVLSQKSSLTELSHEATGFSVFCKIKFVLIYTFLKIQKLDLDTVVIVLVGLNIVETDR